jgi:hypothetical protein
MILEAIGTLLALIFLIFVVVGFIITFFLLKKEKQKFNKNWKVLKLQKILVDSDSNDYTIANNTNFTVALAHEEMKRMTIEEDRKIKKKKKQEKKLRKHHNTVNSSDTEENNDYLQEDEEALIRSLEKEKKMMKKKIKELRNKQGVEKEMEE